MSLILKFLKWAAEEALEKVNYIGTIKKLHKLWQKYGWRFAIPASIWTFFEDVVAPILALIYGYPEIAATLFFLHFEPIVYPMILWAIRTYDRIRGREPWEPERDAYSSHLRSICKVLLYKMSVTGYLVMIPYIMGHSPKMMLFYVPLMTAFGFVHERVWHDSNYGISQKDVVHHKRVIAKGLTYGLVSTIVLDSFCKAAHMPWTVLAMCQAAAVSMYVIYEAVWMRTSWGISPIATKGAR